MSLLKLLRTESSEYELFAEGHAERAPVDDEHFVACQALAVVGIVVQLAQRPKARRPAVDRVGRKASSS